MDVRDLVTLHYGSSDLVEAVLGALAESGYDVERLGAEDLFPLDQLHAGGVAATRHVLDALGLAPGDRLLDVGCGIGGTSRLALTYGARVTGIDLTPEFVAAASELTERAGLGEGATFLATPGESMPLEDATFDAAVMIHVGMNIPDKQEVFAEVRRVLRPGGRFAVYEQMRTGDGELPWPMPWAEDERSSFVERPSDYTRQLEAAGFTVTAVEDFTASTLGPPPGGTLSPMAVFGEFFVRRIGNNVAATKAGDLGAFVIVATS